MKQFRWIVILPALAALIGCSGGANSGAAPQPQPVYRSEVQAGGAIAVKTRVLSDVVVNQPVTVELLFPGNPRRSLWLDITDSDDYRINGDYRRYIQGGAKGGTLSETVELVPLVAGKHYLRMFVSDSRGQNPRSVVVALPVKDATGSVPRPEKKVRSRIDFESTPDR